jgi:hypothetical protein
VNRWGISVESTSGGNLFQKEQSTNAKLKQTVTEIIQIKQREELMNLTRDW